MNDTTRTIEARAQAGDAAITDMYVELLKKALTHSLYSGGDAIAPPSKNPLKRALLGALEKRGIRAIRQLPDHEAQQAVGAYWPMFAQTMIGRERLDNLHECVETVLRDGVPGHFIETGVWRGGSCIFMRALLHVHGVTDRCVYLADSFRGLPAPDAEKYPADAGALFHTADALAVSLEQVKDNFRRYGLLDDQVRFLEGWFKDTLPGLGAERFAIARLDGDMYESTMDALTHLYPRLSPGGFLIVDDHSIESCAQAVADYRAAHGITEEIEEIDWTGVLWRKSADAPAQD